MLTKDCADLIESLFEAADRAFDEGNSKLCSLKLWEAAECALSAVAESREVPSATEDDHFDLLELLMAETGRRVDIYDGYDLVSGYLVAGFVQENIEHDFMEDYLLESSRWSVRRFVKELLPFAEKRSC
ncbi:MAG: hypothetical protein F4X64_13625 [Chloroflexi bacterium]|nr:hypothetical protein [Chloroflexota bacterium]